MGEGVLGYNAIGEFSATLNDDYFVGNMYQAPANGVGSKISAYNNLTSGYMRGALFTFNGVIGETGTVDFVIGTEEVAGSGLKWYDMNFTSPPQIVKDQIYWITIIYSSNASPRYCDAGCSPPDTAYRYTKLYTYENIPGSGYPTDFTPTLSGSLFRKYSIYMTYDLDAIAKSIQETLYAYRNI